MVWPPAIKGWKPHEKKGVTQVFEALRYKSGGRGSYSRWDHWEFLSTWSFRPHCNVAVERVFNGNEYQEHFLGGKGGWFLGLTPFSPSCAHCLEILGPSVFRKPKGLSRPVRGQLYCFTLMIMGYTLCGSDPATCIHEQFVLNSGFNAFELTNKQKPASTVDTTRFNSTFSLHPFAKVRNMFAAQDFEIQGRESQTPTDDQDLAFSKSAQTNVHYGWKEDKNPLPIPRAHDRRQ